MGDQNTILDAANARHLIRRAGFGAPLDQVSNFTGMTRGEAADERSDIFGLGALLYLILTGRPPYTADKSLELLVLAQEGKVVPPRRLARGVPRALEAVCLKALAEFPANRYASATELAEEVKRWLAGEPVAAYDGTSHPGSPT